MCKTRETCFYLCVERIAIVHLIYSLRYKAMILAHGDDELCCCVQDVFREELPNFPMRFAYQGKTSLRYQLLTLIPLEQK